MVSLLTATDRPVPFVNPVDDRPLTLWGETAVKHWSWALGILGAASLATAFAQPPGGPGGGRPPSPVIEALDADHDGVISTEELKNAAAALAKLDKNGDGKVTEDEFRPQGGGPGGPGGAGGPQGGQGRGPGAGPGGQGQGRGQGGPGAGPGGQGQGRSPGGQGGGPGGGPGGGGPGGPGMGPDPERMLAHAFEFDADNDGKLSKAEMQKFIAAFSEMHRLGPPGGQGGPGAGPGGQGGPGGRPPGGNGNNSGARPKRPE